MLDALHHNILMKIKYAIGKDGKQIVLAHECEKCKGTGSIDSNTECGDCDGTGAWATEDGIQIYGFVRDVMLKKGKW